MPLALKLPSFKRAKFARSFACPLSRCDDASCVQRGLVVSIHDVAPATKAQVERILAQLARLGVPSCSLLVVPDYHHLGRSLGDRAFVEWLRNLAALGHEIVIHGFYHQRARGAGESLRQKFVTRVYTADEGEFYDLDYEKAARRMHEAQKEFAENGFHSTGFIAPAWLLGTEARRAAIDVGFRYTTTLSTVDDCATDKKFMSQSLVYSVRSGWRRTMSLAWNCFLFWRLTTNPLLRLSIHPPDIAFGAIWRQIGGLIDKALHTRTPMTYQQWIAHNSAVRTPQSALS
jgi:predicted deacetylase